MNLEIITMVYKSTAYTQLTIDELRKKYCQIPGWDIKLKVLVNDGTPEVRDYVAKSGIHALYYNDPNPTDYYLNRVYRCWNFGARTSTYDNICFVNSDMVFSNLWLENLLKVHDGTRIPCSRLVESGKLLSGRYAVSQDFGRTPQDILYNSWYRFAETLSKNSKGYGGLYMPCIFETKRFLEAGGYPEGNMYADGAGTLNGPVLQSGDEWFFKKLEREYGMLHTTVFDSIVYHIQEGEKDS